MQRIPQHKGDDPLGDKAGPHQVIRHRGVAFFGGKTLREQVPARATPSGGTMPPAITAAINSSWPPARATVPNRYAALLIGPPKSTAIQSPQHRGHHHAAAALHTGQQLVYPGIKPSKRRIDEEYHHKADHGQAGHRI